MKALLKYSFTLALMLALSLSLVGAAAPEQAEKVAQRMLDFDKALTQASTQIEVTLTSMNAIATAAPADMASKYKDFTSQVKKLQGMADKAKAQSQKSAAQREEYLKQWQASQAKIQNPELQAASEARRNELMPKIDAIKTSLGAARDAFGPFMQDLNDLVLYFGDNLSASGMTGAKPLMEKCDTDGTSVKTNIAAGQTAIKDLASSISPSGATKK